MKTMLWIYAVSGLLYFLLYVTGNALVVRYAVGPLWLLMMAAPVTLNVLLLLAIARRFGWVGKGS